MSAERENWDVQIDRCLMGAASHLIEAAPSTFEEHCQIAHGWMALADSWMHRQDNELQCEAWLDEHEYEDA